MDAGNYRAYKCGGCLSDFSGSNRGRPPKMCGGCKDEANRIAQIPCKSCMALFSPKRRDQANCSRACRESAGAAPVAQSMLCKQCGDNFKPSKRISLYCSSACKVAAWRKTDVGAKSLARYAEEAKMRAHENRPPPWSRIYLQQCRHCAGWCGTMARANYCSDTCSSAARQDRQQKAASAPRRERVEEFVCRDCGVFSTRVRTTCPAKSCADCSALREKALKRAGRAKRKALMRGACSAESVDPLKVLRSAGWKCAACGKDTPKSKRGTCDPDAPEVDHITPIARGGRHEYSNLQCLCRGCNGSKWAKIEWTPTPMPNSAASAGT